MTTFSKLTFQAPDIVARLSGEISDLQTELAAHDADTGTLVHKARKCCKRWRSYIGLLRGRDRRAIRSFSKAIQSAMKSIGAVRDAAVTAKAAASLSDTAANADGEMLSAITPPDTSAEQAALGLFASHLEAAAAGLAHPGQGPLSPRAGRLKKSLKAVHAWRHKAQQGRSTQDLHRWRRSIQRLREQIAFAVVDSDAKQTLLASLAELSALLGEDHDLAVLTARLCEAGVGAETDMIESAVEQIVARRSMLQDQAFLTAEAVF